MPEDIYEKLADYLDTLPAGYPRTESGVELRILKRLFTPEDAALAMHLTLIPEKSSVIAYRAGISNEDAQRHLDDMDKKGLIFSVQLGNKPPRYRIDQFIVGFWESQVNQLTPELVRDFEEYLPAFVNLDTWQKVPQLRTIPVEESIHDWTEIMAYERAYKIVSAHTKFAVLNCICRQEQRMLGKGCDMPLESCLSFGSAAEHSIRIGRSREITREEVFKILQRAEKAGLVLQTANARKSVFICTCCGCCCGVLRSIKSDPKPASRISNPFVVKFDQDTCTGCGTCVERCQMDAFHLHNDKVILNPDRCIGCGLCVTTCPTGSLSLLRKPKKEQSYVPVNLTETYIRLGHVQGKMSIKELIALKMKSIMDRLTVYLIPR
jgi:electron transport complex protein RnfB